MEASRLGCAAARRCARLAGGSRVLGTDKPSRRARVGEVGELGGCLALCAVAPLQRAPSAARFQPGPRREPKPIGARRSWGRGSRLETRTKERASHARPRDFKPQGP